MHFNKKKNKTVTKFCDARNSNVLVIAVYQKYSDLKQHYAYRFDGSGTWTGSSRDGWPLFCDIWDLRREDSKAGAHAAGGWNPLESSGAWCLGWDDLQPRTGDRAALKWPLCVAHFPHSTVASEQLNLSRGGSGPLNECAKEGAATPLMTQSQKCKCLYPCSGDQSSHKPTRIEGSTQTTPRPHPAQHTQFSREGLLKNLGAFFKMKEILKYISKFK